MPVQIGVTAHHFSNPTGLLSDCHRRIEMFLGSLEAVAKIMDQPLTEETARALATALRYFREAAPKHNADEEESLFPRLRQVQNPEVQSALGKLKELEDDHRWSAPLHAEIDHLGGEYLSKGSLSTSEAENFRRAVASLVFMYREHISVEDHFVFPMAARVLSQADQASIAREMAARRNVALATEAPDIRKQK